MSEPMPDYTTSGCLAVIAGAILLCNDDVDTYIQYCINKHIKIYTPEQIKAFRLNFLRGRVAQMAIDSLPNTHWIIKEYKKALKYNYLPEETLNKYIKTPN